MKFCERLPGQDNCPILKASKLVGDMWVILIIRDLLQGPQRFNQLQQSLRQISAKTLSDRLKLLETMEIVNRQVYDATPVKIEYQLTEKGQALSTVIKAVAEYGKNYLE